MSVSCNATSVHRCRSAELRPGQKDSDSLPPYEVLDPILEAFIEEDLSVAEITERGFERDIVIRVLELFGLARQVRTPSSGARAAKRLPPAP